MKTTLTSADPSGWYECERIDQKSIVSLWWSGTVLRLYPDAGYEYKVELYTNYRRISIKHDVAALNEELRTLREELATNKHSLDVCSKYAESMQRSSEDYLSELRKAREENATLQNQADGLLKQAEQLEAELARLKSQPYVMRRADKPDCEGLWRNAHGDICKVKSEKDIDAFGEAPPYHYLGPIPVVVEQQPPRVVTINYQGKNMRAIPSDNPEYWTLLGDNGITCGVAIGKFEEVQS